MPKGSKVEHVENKLKREYPGGTRQDQALIYGTLNKVGLMHGNKPTAKGRQPQKRAGTRRR